MRLGFIKSFFVGTRRNQQGLAKLRRGKILPGLMALALIVALGASVAPVVAASTATESAQTAGLLADEGFVSWSAPGSLPIDAWPTVDQIKAKAYVVIDRPSGTILLAQNATTRQYPASTTKIMTALLALENLELDQQLTVSATALNLPSDASRVGLVEGESLSVRDTLAAMMLRSGNEAANMVAEAVSGSQPLFAARMNYKARLLGLDQTHFRNANGLHHKDHYSTALDLARLTAVAMDHPAFRDLVQTSVYALPATNKHPYNGWNILTNTNLRLLWEENANYQSVFLDRITGIKTGTTAAAGQCLVSSAITRDGQELIAVLLGVTGNDPEGNLVVYSRALLEAGAQQAAQLGLAPAEAAVLQAAGFAEGQTPPADNSAAVHQPAGGSSTGPGQTPLLAASQILLISDWPYWPWLITIGAGLGVLLLGWLGGYWSGKRAQRQANTQK